MMKKHDKAHNIFSKLSSSITVFTSQLRSTLVRQQQLPAKIQLYSLAFARHSLEIHRTRLSSSE